MSQKLTFTMASVLNTIVANDNDTLYYDIQTPEWDPNVTTVRRLDRRTGMFELTGKVRSGGSKVAEVSLYGEEYEPDRQWIKRVDGTKPGESRWQFDDGEGNAFAWSVTSSQLELYSADEGTKTKRALATFHQHKRYLYVGMISEYPYVEVDETLVDSLDAILLSLLIVEQKRRAGRLA